MITRMEIDRVIVFFNLVDDSEILVIYDQYCQTPNPGETWGLTLLSCGKNYTAHPKCSPRGYHRAMTFCM